MNMIELVDFNGISYLTREINEANERFNSLISRDCHSIVTNDVFPPKELFNSHWLIV